MTGDTDLELVRDLHPESASASPRARERARAALLREMGSDGGSKRRPTRRRSRSRLVRPIGILAVAIAVVVALVVGAELRGGVARPTSAAAAVLQRAARAAEASGGPRELRPGEYWYVHSLDTGSGVNVPTGQPHQIVQMWDALASWDRQIWIGRDRPGWLATRNVGTIKFLSESARREWGRFGRPTRINPVGDIALPANAFDVPYSQLLALPANVDALWHVVRTAGGAGSPAERISEMFTKIGDLLREDPVPPRVRAALYLVAARIPGIRMLGLTHDGIGRPALAVALDNSFSQLREELLFDPRTAKLLGESQVRLKADPRAHVRAGTVFFESTYLASGIVSRIGQRVH